MAKFALSHAEWTCVMQENPSDMVERPGRGEKIYSLGDCSVPADFVTCPSRWEGWGNQLIEAMFARLPVVLFGYPVWLSNQKSAGLDVVSPGNRIEGRGEWGLVSVPQRVLERAADHVVGMLADPRRRAGIVKKNYAICMRAYSIGTSEALIGGVLRTTGIHANEKHIDKQSDIC